MQVPNFTVRNINVKNILKKYWPIIIFALLPIAILGPVLGRGYILQYDMVFTPFTYINLDGPLSIQKLPVQLTLKMFNYILPLDVVQKIILYAIFFVSALAMYLALPVKSNLAKLAAGIFYAINPFTYDRLMAGHWLFLLGYALTPFAVWSFYKLLATKKAKYIFVSILAWSIIAAISPHHFIIILILFLSLCIFYVRSKKILIYSMYVLLGSLLVNLWWAIPGLMSANTPTQFGLDQYYAFSTKADLNQGIWFNMITLQGFWYSGWLSIKSYFSLWPIIMIVWLLPVFLGASCLKYYSSSKVKLALGLIIASIIALIFASGPGSYFWLVNSWAYTHIPGLTGFREPQKFLAILAVCYSLLIAYGINILAVKKHTKAAIATTVFSIIMIALATWPIFCAGQGQINNVDYPESWQQAKQYVDQQPKNSKTLVLPWGLYLNNTFAKNLVANPAKKYFGNTVISSESMNLPNVTDNADSQYSDIASALSQKDLNLFIESAKNNNITNVIVVESDGSNSYNWLDAPGVSEVIQQNEDLKIIKLTN